jgi:SnoaL-like domain
MDAGQVVPPRLPVTNEARSIHAELEALNVEFWYRVDHHDGVGVGELFTEQGIYSSGAGRNVGRTAISTSYRQRAARGPRVARHVHSNQRITIEAPDRARGVSIVTLWARDGHAPLDAVLPVIVADVHDEYVRGADGVWYIEHRHLVTAFQGPEPAVLPFESPDAGEEDTPGDLTSRGRTV